MYNVLVLAKGGNSNPGLLRNLEEEGVRFTVAPSMEAIVIDDVTANVDAVLVDMTSGDRDTLLKAVEGCHVLNLPVLCGLSSEILWDYEASWGATDFFVVPPNPGEVTARIRQARQHDHLEEVPAEDVEEKILQTGDLRIDLDKYEVFNRGKRVLLTFKEYKLLCTLAASPGRVFSRETLLSQIWEYDYYGGTRTVDVHIRRLRSKIEDPGHSYIETVWNVGYRFRSQAA